MIINISHPVALFPQPTDMTCWSACVTMLFGNLSAGPGAATTAPSGGLGTSAQNMEAFAASYNLRLHYPQSWSVEALASLLRSGPLMVCGALPAAHAVVVGGMFGDGTAAGTTLTIYDPWPPGQGRVITATYQRLIQTFPMATRYVLHR